MDYNGYPLITCLIGGEFSTEVYDQSDFNLIRCFDKVCENFAIERIATTGRPLSGERALFIEDRKGACPTICYVDQASQLLKLVIFYGKNCKKRHFQSIDHLPDNEGKCSLGANEKNAPLWMAYYAPTSSGKLKIATYDRKTMNPPTINTLANSPFHSQVGWGNGWVLLGHPYRVLAFYDGQKYAIKIVTCMDPHICHHLHERSQVERSNFTSFFHLSMAANKDVFMAYYDYIKGIQALYCPFSKSSATPKFDGNAFGEEAQISQLFYDPMRMVLLGYPLFLGFLGCFFAILF